MRESFFVRMRQSFVEECADVFERMRGSFVEECADVSGRMRGSFVEECADVFGRMRGSFVEECADVVWKNAQKFFWRNGREFFGRMRGCFLEECAGAFRKKTKYSGTVYCMHACCIILIIQWSFFRLCKVRLCISDYSQMHRSHFHDLIYYSTFFPMCRVWLRSVGDGAEWDVSFWENAQKEEIQKRNENPNQKKAKRKKSHGFVFENQSFTWTL
jgi:hypothetical protein